MNFFQVMSIVKLAMPIITTAIKGVEKAMPGEGKGEKKLAAVRLTLETVFGEDGIIDDLWPLFSTIISAKVGVYNTKPNGFDL